jgi:Fic family protein
MVQDIDYNNFKYGTESGKMDPLIKDPAQMDPMMPPEGQRHLEDIAFDLVSKASSLAGRMSPIVTAGVGELVRSMNCYYSNLIEGHSTRLRDINRALRQDYASEPERRKLQVEAVAHIEVQQAIDENRDEKAEPTALAYTLWLHREFCRRLPEDTLWLEDKATNRIIRIEPGEFRDGEVAVGRHLPPAAELLPPFFEKFENAYRSENLSRVRQVIAIAAAHHRFVWIHPFYDVNGRVARLMSHASLKRLGIGSALWSVSRGLARNVDRYKSLLMAADEPEKRGASTLSTEGLVNFCQFFLDVCIDQIEFMGSVLAPSELARRMEIYTEDEVRANRLPKGSFTLLREALLAGEFERGAAPSITGYKERMARNVLSKLLELGLLTSTGPKAAVRLGFPVNVIERWFPSLFPANAF